MQLLISYFHHIWRQKLCGRCDLRDRNDIVPSSLPLAQIWIRVKKRLFDSIWVEMNLSDVWIFSPIVSNFSTKLAKKFLQIISALSGSCLFNNLNTFAEYFTEIFSFSRYFEKSRRQFWNSSKKFDSFCSKFRRNSIGPFYSLRHFFGRRL